MKNRFRIIIVIIISIIVVGFTIYYILNKNEGDTTLSILDKKWIESNKDQIVDIAVLNNLSIYGYEGKGIFFEFIEDFEKSTGLEFNKVPYEIGSNPSLGEYIYKILGTNAKLENNQILIYEDFYVLLSKNGKKFDNIKDINGYNVGTINDDISAISYFLTNGNALTYKPYDSSTELFNAFDSSEIDLMVIPYNLYLNEILATNNYHIVFHLNEVSRKYVLQLSKNNNRLNSIITKYYKKWLDNNYETVYNRFLFESYLMNRNIDSVTRNEFQGKRYTYGLITNLPYEMALNDELIGISGEYINLFSNIAGAEFKLLEYKKLEDLNKAIADGKVDISFNYYNTQVNKGYIKTMSPYNEEYVLIAHKSTSAIVNSLKSMQGKTVYVLKNSLLSNYVKEYSNVNVVEYKTIENLSRSVDQNSFILLDSNIYRHYEKTKFNNFKILYTDKLNKDYTFLIKSNAENKTFIDLYSKFISTANYKEVVNNANIKLLDDPVRQNLLQTISRYTLLIIVIFFFFVKFSVSLFTKKRVVKKLRKEEKIKYTDILTSLKNRNYLNDNIEKWEDGKIFPQAIIIVDLNNVKYVNDNYGHEEGDNLIKKAASILINTQLENSEIIRTDGNEFLIYLVGYTEQQIVSYTRKLYKEFKNLPHEFGAALGFSMIEDEIKTIDDAINEATLDMRTNKEGQKE